jgi:hypothetical protein
MYQATRSRDLCEIRNTLDRPAFLPLDIGLRTISMTLSREVARWAIFSSVLLLEGRSMNDLQQ